MPEPEKCYELAIDGLQDLSSYLDTLQCKHQETWPWLIQKYYKTKQRFIGHPKSTQLPEALRTAFEFPSAILDNSKGYSTLTEALAHEHEFIIDTVKSKVHVTVKRNATLAMERKKAQKVDRGELKENLLLIHVETVSRRKVFEKLPSVAQFLK